MSPVARVTCLVHTCLCAAMAGVSGSMLATFYPAAALAKQIPITTTGHVFGVRWGGIECFRLQVQYHKRTREEALWLSLHYFSFLELSKSDIALCDGQMFV